MRNRKKKLNNGINQINEMENGPEKSKKYVTNNL